jgi:hypothetical protein
MLVLAYNVIMFEKLLKLPIFILLSVIFLPAFLIVNYLGDTWSKMLNDLFNL